MSKSVKIKPREGLKVFNPATMLHLKKDGEDIVLNPYWRRMLKCGDAELVKKQSKPRVSKARKSKTNNEENSEE